MRDDLTRQLEAVLEAEHKDRSPNLEWVVARGRRIRALRFATIVLSVVAIVGVVSTALVALPSDRGAPDLVTGGESPSSQPARTNEVVEEMTEQDRAEIFAFRALAATELMNPFGKRSYNFTYRDDTTRTSEGWRVGFAASACEPREGGFTCTALSGEERNTGNALTDTYVTVALEGDRWKVVGVEGNMLEEERERVIGYTLMQLEEPSHWEFPAVGLWPSDDDASMGMVALWVGPYPTSAPGSVCEIEAVNDEGEAAEDRNPLYVEPPNRAFERAGWHRSGELGFDAAEVRVECRQYTGPGWEVASDARIVGSPGDVTGVTAELVWRGDEGFTAAAVCRATLVDEVGAVVWEGSGRVEPLWRSNELKNYPYRANVLVTTRGEPVDAEGVGEFTCKSR